MAHALASHGCISLALCRQQQTFYNMPSNVLFTSRCPTAQAVVLEMEVCNRQTGMRSFSQPNQSSWAGAVLGGFIVACVANYLSIVSAPALMRAEAQLEARGSPLSKEIQI